MNKIIIIIAILSVIILLGCVNKQRKCYLTIQNKIGWNFSTIECDSFQMHGTKKADVWVDGRWINVETELAIYPHVREN